MADATSVSEPQDKGGHVWFVYDGDCPLCRTAAQALRMKSSVGELHLVDARNAPGDPVLAEVNARGLDLDEGAVIKYGGRFYHGDDAIHMMALLGSGQGWFNRMNAGLFRSKTMARVCYPAMRGTRNFLVWLRGAGKLRNLHQHPEDPIFKQAFGVAWDTLPKVMRLHYAPRAFSDDRVIIEGHLDVEVSPLMAVLARISGNVVPYSGKNVPVEVAFYSDEDGNLYFDRTFSFPGRKPYLFRSRLVHLGGHEYADVMRFGIGWAGSYDWDGVKMVISHRRYVWRVFGRTLTIPMQWLIGEAEAEESVTADGAMFMWTHTKHKWFGKTFGYTGTFRVKDVALGETV